MKTRILPVAVLTGLAAVLVSIGGPSLTRRSDRPSAERFRLAMERSGERELAELRERQGITNRETARPIDRSLDRVPFDQPQEALDFFLAKRLPAGQTSLPMDRYEAALAQSREMPLYSSAMGQLVSSGTGGKGERTARDPERDAGLGTWEPLGPGNVGGRTRALLIHPTAPNIIWAAGVAGGIWKSTNGGTSWTPKGDLLVNIAVNSMILDPRDPNVIYAGTGEGFFNSDAVRGQGIFKSVDGGENWTQLPSTNNSSFYYVQKLAVTRGSQQRIYAATRSGIFRSSDGGATWQQMFNATAINGCMDVVIQTDRPLAFVFAACGTFTQAAVYRALDSAGVQNWTSVFSPANMGRTSLALAPSNQSVIYALSASNESGNLNQGLLGVFRSTSSGASGTWTTRVSNASPTKLNTLLLTNPVIAVLTECGFGTSASLTQGWYDNVIAVDPKNPDIVWVGGIDLFRSDDGGANFGQASHWWFTPGVDPEYNHADHHAIVFHPQYDGVTNKTMYSGNDGGLFRTLDARAPVSYSPNPITAASPVCGSTPAGVLSWTALNNGYETTQFYHGLPYPDGLTFFGGTQDNGTIRGTTVGGRNGWASIFGGDGGYVAINPSDTNMLWEETTGLSIRRSTNGGASWSSVTSGITEAAGNFLFIVPFAQDPSTAARMWIGGAFMWRAGNATGSPAPNPYWTRASAFFGTRVSAIAAAPSNSDRVYAGTQTGLVFTTDIATTAISTTAWSSSQPRGGTNYVSWVAVHPTDPLTVFATVSTFNSGANTGHVFKSVNGGTSWTNIDGAGLTGIPDVPVHCIVIDPANTNRLYAFTHGRSAWRVQLQ